MTSILPIRLTFMTQTNMGVANTFTDSSDPSDPYAGFPYQWNIKLTITPQPHSCHITPTPFFYNGLDVKVGDWITTVDGGYAVKIISITTQTDSEVDCVVEDVDRFNTMTDNTQNGVGIGPDGAGFIFEISDDGLPIVGPIPQNAMPPTVQTDLISRFRYRNSKTNFIRVYQPSHGLAVGNIIRPDPATSGNYLIAKGDSNVTSVVGVVVEVGVPTSDYFNFRPLGRVISDAPNLVGNPGDLFYADPTTDGAVTSTAPSVNARPIFMRLDSTTNAIQLDRNNSDERLVKPYQITTVTNGQTVFTLPTEAADVIEFTINGLESKNFTFSAPNVTFDASAEGFSLESTDEVRFVYRT